MANAVVPENAKLPNVSPIEINEGHSKQRRADLARTLKLSTSAPVTVVVNSSAAIRTTAARSCATEANVDHAERPSSTSLVATVVGLCYNHRYPVAPSHHHAAFHANAPKIAVTLRWPIAVTVMRKAAQNVLSSPLRPVFAARVYSRTSLVGWLMFAAETSVGRHSDVALISVRSNAIVLGNARSLVDSLAEKSSVLAVIRA